MALIFLYNMTTVSKFGGQPFFFLVSNLSQTGLIYHWQSPLEELWSLVYNANPTILLGCQSTIILML